MELKTLIKAIKLKMFMEGIREVPKNVLVYQLDVLELSECDVTAKNEVECQATEHVTQSTIPDGWEVAKQDDPGYWVNLGWNYHK